MFGNGREDMERQARGMRIIGGDKFEPIPSGLGCSPGSLLLTSNFEFRLPVDAHKLHASDSIRLDYLRAPHSHRLTNGPPVLSSIISFRPRFFRRAGDRWFRST
jgi:hypothetical protein